MMGPDDDLPSLVKRKDHLGVLRYIRNHELRETALVVEHGQALLGGPDVSKKLDDESARISALEQLCVAALDVHDHDLAERCLSQIKAVPDGVVDVQSSVRYRRLLARCLEASKDYEGAGIIYDDLLRENPSNAIALQRKYCILKAQNKLKTDPQSVIKALNDYVGQQLSDVSGWYEMAQLRMSLGDWKSAAYALEQVVLGSPLDADIHRQLAEVYATIGTVEYLTLSKKHMAQALELDPTNLRAQWGLISVSNQYLELVSDSSSKVVDDHEKAVAKELVKYGADAVLQSYKSNTKMMSVVQRVVNDYTDNLA
jgi:ER membrane protein complex subunit 2